jgi:ATP-dependent DNA ligase
MATYPTIIKPMLAKSLKLKNLTYPLYVQPKLNGIRAIRNSPTTILSRGAPNESGKVWQPNILTHITSALQHISPSILLDGELYRHGLSLQQINARVAVNRVTPHPDESSIQYHVFDFVSTLPFAHRLTQLERLATYLATRNITTIRVVETLLVHSERELLAAYKMWKLQGYEGLMARVPDAPYGLAHACGNKENRWNCLLKLKDTIDVEAYIIDVNEGEGRLRGSCGALQLVTKDGVEFNSGGGLDDYQRMQLWARRHELKGSRTKVRVLCEEFSDTGVPLRNRIDCIDLKDFE